jgi:hypothetical protein
MDVLARAVAQYRAEERRTIEVAEWGEDGKPLVVTYLPVTLDDQSFVSQAAEGDRYGMAAHLVAYKACDASGSRMFKQIDAATLRRSADPQVILRISAQMLGGLTLEQAEKN